MRQAFTILLILLLASCKNALVTDNEVKAGQRVLDFYGGDLCNRSKGFNTTNGVKTTYFELEICQNVYIERYSKVLELPASNIAYIFYSNLKEDQEKYTHIKVKINLKNGTSHEYQYSAEDLKEAEEFIPVLQTVSEKIKTKDHTGLLSMFDTVTLPDLTIEQLQAFCARFDSEYGRITAAQFQGFSFYKSETYQRPMVLIGGVIKGEKENTDFSIAVDRKTKKLFTIQPGY